MSYETVADGELAAVVTYLEMRRPPDQSVPASPLRLERVEVPQPEHYRALFRLVGGPWLWFSRLLLDDAHLAEIIQHPRVELYSVRDESGREAGMLELDFREPGECELAFIGLLPELAGQGHGRWLLAEAVRLAWREGVDRVHVHTCSLDHPAALAAYRRAGFTPFKRAVERFPDPRLRGILPRDSAPQVPLLGTDA
jgi:GNAT superfamily N-acetyltransferase